MIAENVLGTNRARDWLAVVLVFFLLFNCVYPVLPLSLGLHEVKGGTIKMTILEDIFLIDVPINRNIRTVYLGI